jgi:hypothetical protein
LARPIHTMRYDSSLFSEQDLQTVEDAAGARLRSVAEREKEPAAEGEALGHNRALKTGHASVSTTLSIYTHVIMRRIARLSRPSKSGCLATWTVLD